MARRVLTLGDLRDLATATSRVRRLLDLDADPDPIDAQLGDDRHLGPLVVQASGRRVSRSVDPEELAVGAVLGQQVSTAAARRHAARLVARHGTPIDDPDGGLRHLFPDSATLADLDPATLAMPQTRRSTLATLAGNLAAGDIDLGPAADWG